MQTPDKRQVHRVLVYQAVTALGLAAATLAFGAMPAVSVLVGGGTSALANGLFAWRVFRPYRAQDPGALMRGLYLAEAAKILVTLALFTAAFVLIEGLGPVWTLGAYLAVQTFPAVLAAQTGAGRTRES